jgi:uncharacterized membrane protein YkvA (DUF1232 family)
MVAPNLTPAFTKSSPQGIAAQSLLADMTTQDLAQALAERLALSTADWHRLKSNRKVRAQEMAAVALVYLLQDQPEEALPRLQQAVGWLDRTISAPPCPDHGH